MRARECHPDKHPNDPTAGINVLDNLISDTFSDIAVWHCRLVAFDSNVPVEGIVWYFAFKPVLRF